MTELEKEMLAALTTIRDLIQEQVDEMIGGKRRAYNWRSIVPLINEEAEAAIRLAESQKDDQATEDTRSARAAKGRAR
jgi:hypothetical protein